MIDQKMEIAIVISGPCNSGKSRITYVIAELLRKYEFDVSVTDFDMTAEEFSKLCSFKLDETLKNLTKRSKINISQKQTSRKPLDKRI